LGNAGTTGKFRGLICPPSPLPGLKSAPAKVQTSPDLELLIPFVFLCVFCGSSFFNFGNLP